MPTLPPVASSIVAFELEDSKTLIQTVLALLNTYGGDIYLGVTPNREVVGVTNPVDLQTRLMDIFRKKVYPLALPYLAFSSETFEGHSVLRVHVDHGDERPYRLAHDDVSSIFVRVGASNRQATEKQIAQFVREANPTPWAKRQSKEQVLTFEALDLWTSARHIAFDVHDVALGFWDPVFHGFTNLASLFSDNNPFEVQFNVYLDHERLYLDESRVLNGSLIQQMDDLLAAILKTCCAGIAKEPCRDLARIDLYDLPKVALQDALIHAFIHRDYTRAVRLKVDVTPREVRIVTVGGPIDLVAPECVLWSPKCSPHPEIVKYFKAIHLIDTPAFGFERIASAYAHCDLTELITIGSSFFEIRLPRFLSKTKGLFSDPLTASIYALIRTQKAVTRHQIETVLNAPRSTVSYKLLAMMKAKLIAQEGRGRNTVYVLADE